MKEFNFKKIDAFTTGLSSGNPAGFIHLLPNESVTEKEMQQISYELGDFVNETAFVRQIKGDEADFEFRYFSKEKEVPFCGHATIAVCHELINDSANLAKKAFFRIKTQNGIFQIFNAFESENSVYIEAPKPHFHKIDITYEDISNDLNIGISQIDSAKEIACLTVGQKFLLLPVNKKDTVTDYIPEYSNLRKFYEKTGIEIIVLYSDDTVFEGHDFRTRVFPPGFGYLEDPATGSGNAALAYHQMINCKWRKDTILIEQGSNEMNPNIIKLKKNEKSVLIGGSAVLRIKGKYFLCL